MLLAAVVLESALLARLPLPGPTPDLVLLVVIGAALANGANIGAVTGFSAGLLTALAPPSVAPMGLHAILYAVIGYLIGSRAAGERLARGELAGLAAGAGALVASIDLAVSAVWGSGWPHPGQALVIVALQAAYCAVLAVVVTPAVSTSVAALPGRW